MDWRAREIFAEIQEGKVKYKIGAVHPFDEVKKAHDDLEGRKTTGKVLLRVI
jgi:NADPH2:quinone reductase